MIELIVFQVFSVVLAHRRFSGFLLCLKKKHLCLHVLGLFLIWNEVLGSVSPKVPILTEFLSISDSMNHGRWFFGKLKQAEWRKKWLQSHLPEELRTCIWICRICRGKLLSGVLQIPGNQGLERGWALIISDGKVGNFLVMPLGKRWILIYSLVFLLCFPKELGMFPFFPMTSEVDVSSH